MSCGAPDGGNALVANARERKTAELPASRDLLTFLTGRIRKIQKISARCSFYCFPI